jgi:lipopolysaccharide exporter
MSATSSPKSTLLVGAAWTVGGRWAIKGIGFISTIIMARLLVPSDYGVVAMAMLAVGLVQALLDFGASTALLRKGELARAEIDSAWALSVLQGLLIGVLLAAASPFLARYFEEPRVVAVLLTLAACIALTSFTNIGLTLAQKDFQFSLIFRHQVACKVIGAVSTMVAGFLLRDYRALVIGIGIGYLASLVLSYTMHPYRPRWDTSRMREIWGISKWLMFGGIAQFSLRRGDELIAARVGSTHEYGIYNVGADLGQLPTGEVGPALLRALLPVLASLKDDVERANAAVVKTVAALNSITVPIGVGFAALSVQATAVMLGPSWTEAARFVMLFALVNTVQLMANPLGTLLILRGLTRLQSHMVWLEFACFIALSALMVPSLGLVGLAYARLVAGVFNVLAMAVVCRLRCGLSLRKLAFAILRPTVGAALMYLLITACLGLVESLPAQILLGVGAGAAVYMCWAFATWRLSGRPEGFESTALELAGGWLLRRRTGA